MTLETWQINALDHCLLNKETWGDNAVSEGVYPDKEAAWIDKANKCAPRIIRNHESKNGEIVGKTVPEKVIICANDKNYKNRALCWAETCVEDGQYDTIEDALVTL